MKKKLLAGLLTFGCMLYLPTCEAQIWKKVQQKLEDKVEKTLDKTLDHTVDGKKKNESSEETSEKAALPNLEKIYSFAPGAHVLFEDNFSDALTGRMPKKWKSSGGGSVETISGTPGKWLALAARTSYRIDSLLTLPENFTIEFDLITRSVEAKDIGSMSFGFGRDNANRSYIMDAYNDNAITNTQLHFHNKGVTNSSSDTKIYNPVDFPLNSFSNGLLHIAIAVEGEQMRVYINKSKLLDTKMFNKEAIKYFYLTAPFNYKSDAQVYFSNFVISE